MDGSYDPHMSSTNREGLAPLLGEPNVDTAICLSWRLVDLRLQHNGAVSHGIYGPYNSTESHLHTGIWWQCGCHEHQP